LEKKTAVIATSAATKSFSDICLIEAGLFRVDRLWKALYADPLARNDSYATLITIPLRSSSPHDHDFVHSRLAEKGPSLGLATRAIIFSLKPDPKPRRVAGAFCCPVSGLSPRRWINDRPTIALAGPVAAAHHMVEDDRYCIDIVTQIAAARAAHCVEHAISSGDKADQRRKIAELMDVVIRADR
jgi:DNA-binding FrmR family transcriptional regulator